MLISRSTGIPDPASKNNKVDSTLFLFCLLFFAATDCRAMAVTQGPISLGSEKYPVQITFLYKRLVTFPEVANRRLMLKLYNRSVRLDTFGQLRGHVYIGSKEQALNYVRFHDSLYTFFYWRDRVKFEVISKDDATKMPTYGLDRYYKAYPGVAGVAGVISSAAYRQGKFTAPKVTRQGNHFDIVRWMFVPGKPRPGTIQLIRECVSPNGSYRCVTLRSMPVPKLPDTYWRVPKFS